MAKKKVAKVNDNNSFRIATELQTARNNIKAWKKVEESLTAELKEAMHAEQLTVAGPYELSTARTLQVADEAVAWIWARENHCVIAEKIDTSKAKEILRHTFDDPSKFGFAVVESERVVPTGKGDKDIV